MNLLKEQSEFILVGKRKWAKRIFFRFIKARYRRRINRVVARMQLRRGKVFLKPRVDVIMDGDTDNKYLGLLAEDLKTAREKADYVIVCSHIGGQFNETPGTYSRFMADFVLEHGADMLIGNHLSASKGYAAMGKAALALDANTFAFFTRNPRGGKAKEIDEKDVEKFLNFAKEHEFGKIVAHAPYTMNLCAAKEDVRSFSKEMLLDDLKRMEYTPYNYYNFHPGSHVGQGAEKGIALIAEALNEALKPEQTPTVLLETMAGKGTEVGRTFEELREILDRVELNDKMGVCLDTCHVWDGGYDIVNDLDDVLNEFDRVIGLDRLKAVHFNDSMNDCGSHKDRHAKIGEGKIGAEAMRCVALHPLLEGRPFIFETPNDDEVYRLEIQMVREWTR